MRHGLSGSAPAPQTPAQVESIREVLSGPWQLVRPDSGGSRRPDQTRMRHRKRGDVKPTPRWYREQTKGEIWMERLVHAVVKHAAEGLFEDAGDFWRVCTGKVHPADLGELLLRPRERRSRKQRYREDHLSWKCTDQEEDGQQTLGL